MAIGFGDVIGALGDTLTRGVGENVDYVKRGGKGKPKQPKPKKPKKKNDGGGGGVGNFLGDVAGGLATNAGLGILGPYAGIAAPIAGNMAALNSIGGGGGGGDDKNKPKQDGGGSKNKNKGGGGRGGIPGSVDYLQNQLGVSRKEARGLVDQFAAEAAIPQELRDFTDQYKAQNVDPLATQLFYSQTVAPYLQQQSQIQQQAATAGQDYMANMIANTQMDPAYKNFLSASTPALLNSQNQAAIAGQAAAVAGPALESIFGRLQADINAKEQLRAYREQQDAAQQMLALGGGTGGMAIDPKTGQIKGGAFG